MHVSALQGKGKKIDPKALEIIVSYPQCRWGGFFFSACFLLDVLFDCFVSVCL